MVKNLHKVNKLLYRSAAPSANDLALLKKHLGIKKVVSLDEQAGKKIHRACAILGITHIMLPIEFTKRSSLLKFLCQDLYALLQEGGPVLIHCQSGIDRTGLACGMFRCRYQGWDPKDAIAEAHKYGGLLNIDPAVAHLYEKLIGFSVPQKKDDREDVNSSFDPGYNIVDQQRSYPSDYNDYTSGPWSQMSWSPFEDYRVREYPFATTYNYYDEQYPNRQDYGLDDRAPGPKAPQTVPQVGQYDTSADNILMGPTFLGSGYV